MNQIQNRQMRLAEVYADIEAKYEELKAFPPDQRTKEAPRWQANYDYALAQLQFRMAYFYEYNAALGRVRKDELPALDKKIHKGYRLNPVDAMIDRDAQKIAEMRPQDAEEVGRGAQGHALGGYRQASAGYQDRRGMEAVLILAPSRTHKKYGRAGFASEQGRPYFAFLWGCKP